MIRCALDGSLMSAAQLAAGLTTSQVVRLADAVPQLEAFIRRAKAVLKQVVSEEGPIDLGDGVFWGPHPKPTKVIDPVLGVEFLAQEIGHDAAAKAVTSTLSQEAIKTAVKAAHEEAGISRKAAKAVRTVMAKLGEAGGISTVEDVWYSAYRPRDAAIETTSSDDDE
jgi:hypothetical protein